MLAALSPSGVSAQEEPVQEEESVVKDPYTLYYSDSLFIGDTIRFRVDRGTYENTREFYDSLRRSAERNYITRMLYEFLMRGEEEHVMSGEEAIDAYTVPYQQFGGQPIREVRINQMDILTGLQQDSSQNPRQWYADVANWLHMPTHEFIIRENLLFASGDTLNPDLLKDNARILRRLDYIKDARFVVQPVKGGGDSVDVVVLTQDLWTKGFDVNLESINAGEIQLFDDNFLGMGHKFQANLIFDYLEPSNPGIETYYRLNNIRGSFIDGRLYYKHAFETNRYGVELNRDFYSSQTRWVGGTSVFRTDTRRNIVQEDTTFRQTRLDYTNHDFWLGHAFPLDLGGGFFENRNRLVLSTRYRNDRYFKHPGVTDRYNYRFHDNQLLLGKVSFSRENFYKSSLVYGFGRTEDIPVGDLFGYTFGWEKAQFFNRFYSGIDLRHGEFIRNFGYLSGGFEAGGFYYDDRVEQGVLRFQSHYISKLFILNELKLRQFFQLNYTYGFNRFPEEHLRLDGGGDIRGFLNDNLYGNEKLVIKAETVGFTDFYYYGFRLALYGFCDIGFLGSEDEFIFSNPMKSGFGLGARLRNENFVFNTFQIRFGFYPNLGMENLFLFNLSGEKNLRPRRYTPDPPHVVDF